MTDDKLKQAHGLRQRIVGLQEDLDLLSKGMVPLHGGFGCSSVAGRLNVDEATNAIIMKILAAQRQVILEGLRAEYAAL